MDFSLEPVLLNSHVVTYHAQSFSDGLFTSSLLILILFILESTKTRDSLNIAIMRAPVVETSPQSVAY